MKIARTVPALLAAAMMTGALMAQQPGAAIPATMEATPLIPRATFFGNPDRAGPQVSPDGTRIAFLAARDGVLNVFVAPADKPDEAKPVTNDTRRGIRQYFWSYTNQHIIYVQDQGGNENWRIYAVDLATNETKDLTPFENVRAEVEGVSEKFPDTILVGLNRRNPQFHDLFTLNVRTGELKPVLENAGYAGFVTDDDYAVRMAMRFNAQGGMDVLKAKPGENGAIAFEPWETIPQEDTATTSPAGFDRTGRVMFMLDSRGRDTGALVSVNLDTGERKVLAENGRADVSGWMQNPITKQIEAVSSTYATREWTFLDKGIEAEFKELEKIGRGEVSVVSRSQDDRTWIVSFTDDNGPAAWYRYDRTTKTPTFLFTNRRSLEGLPLAPMHPVVIKASDGLNLVSYLTLPVWSDQDQNGRPEQPVPMVLLVHGGPWARDGWGYNGLHQWLSNRGYAVLSVNFRGSTGFGKGFLNAGNMEWAGKMHQDLLDAVDWAVAEGISPRDKVGIMGGSYGGYAALVGLTFTPDVFACGISIVGPSNIVTLLNTIPPYWAPAMQLFRTRVGDHTTEEGRAFLNSRSPLSRVDQIRRPLLIGQGANDPRVKQSESDQIVAAMQSHNIPVTYVLFPDEGHGFARPENNMAFNAITEAFLARTLGGRSQPLGDDVSKSTAQVPHGADYLPGLTEAVAQPRTGGTR